MKLIHKTTRYYLGYTLFILSLGTVLFYFLIRIVLIDSVDEAMRQEEIQIIKNLQYEIIIDSLQPSPNVEIRKTTLDKPYPEKFSTIRIYSEEQKGFVDYRQVKKIIRHNDNYYELIIRQSLQEAETLLFSLLPAVVGLFVFIFLGIIFINSFVLNRIWHPFYELVEKLKKYDILKSKVIDYKHSDIREFNELSIGVEKMTQQIHQDFLNQKEFNENSSHEMQTPLAIIRNKLDLLIQSKNLSENDLSLIEGVYESQKRLTMLNKGLLLISKIDNHQFKEGQMVEMSKVLTKAVEYFTPQMEEKSLLVTTAIQDNVNLKFNSALADILVSNLLSNAIKHNVKGGKLRIELTGQGITVENTGRVLSENPEQMFERFKKDSDLENSIGLGLAIVKKIITLFQFEVSYINEETLHIVKISFNEQSTHLTENA